MSGRESDEDVYDETKWMPTAEKDKLMNSTRALIVNQMIDDRKKKHDKLESLEKDCKAKDDIIDRLNKEIDNLNVTNKTSTDTITRLNTEINDLNVANKTATDKLDQLSKDLDKAQNELSLEKDLSSSLMLRLDKPSTSENEPKPSVLFVADEQLIYELLDATKVDWVFKNLDSLEALEASLDKSDLKKEIQSHDLIVIMLGRSDIPAEGDGIQMLFTVNRIVTKLNEMLIPFRFIQILPVKGPKYRTDLTLYNRRLSAKPDVNPVNISQVFDNLTDFEIYVKTKITIQKDNLKKWHLKYQSKLGPQTSGTKNQNRYILDICYIEQVSASMFRCMLSAWYYT